jgi:glycosyltransferase involved in cell wall biosynthesis
VSVVIPGYNYARFLSEAIESVLGLEYRPIEIVVVNDGSTDQTARVAACYPSVEYCYQPNVGLAAARNTGISKSRETTFYSSIPTISYVQGRWGRQ